MGGPRRRVAHVWQGCISQSTNVRLLPAGWLFAQAVCCMARKSSTALHSLSRLYPQSQLLFTLTLSLALAVTIIIINHPTYFTLILTDARYAPLFTALKKRCSIGRYLFIQTPGRDARIDEPNVTDTAICITQCTRSLALEKHGFATLSSCLPAALPLCSICIRLLCSYTSFYCAAPSSCPSACSKARCPPLPSPCSLLSRSVSITHSSSFLSSLSW